MTSKRYHWGVGWLSPHFMCFRVGEVYKHLFLAVKFQNAPGINFKESIFAHNWYNVELYGNPLLVKWGIKRVPFGVKKTVQSLFF